mgnify:CR=1 FL=1
MSRETTDMVSGRQEHCSRETILDGNTARQRESTNMGDEQKYWEAILGGNDHGRREATRHSHRVRDPRSHVKVLRKYTCTRKLRFSNRRRATENKNVRNFEIQLKEIRGVGFVSSSFT